MNKRFRIDVFTKDDNHTSLYFDTPLEVKTFVTTTERFEIFRNNVEVMYFMEISNGSHYDVKERIRWTEDDYGWCSHPIYWDTEHDEILTTQDLEYEYNTSDQKKYYSSLHQYINACRTYNNGTLEEI